MVGSYRSHTLKEKKLFIEAILDLMRKYNTKDECLTLREKPYASVYLLYMARLKGVEAEDVIS